MLAVSLTFSAVGCSGSGSDYDISSDNGDTNKHLFAQNDSSGNTVVSQGRYVEKALFLSITPETICELYQNENDISFLDAQSWRQYTVHADDEAIDMEKLPLLNTLGNDVHVDTAAGAPNGNCFAIFYDYSVQNEGKRYAYIPAGGKPQEIRLDVIIDDAEFSSDGRLFGHTAYGEIYEIYVEKGSSKLIFQTETPFSNAFDVVNDYIIAGNNENVYFYDYVNDAAVETPEAIQKFISEQGFELNYKYGNYDFCSGEDNSFYIACKNGLFRYVMNGNLVEQLIDETTCHLGNPSYHISSVICETADTFLISYHEGAVMRYYYDKEAPNEYTSTLKIYSLTKNDTLSQIISEYGMQHPDVRIDYEIGGRSGITYDDALRNLTTELLSGNAPDVIMLDGLDIDNYVEKGVLADLSASESEWNPDNALLDNVAKWNFDGGLYSVACKFGIPTMVADSEILTQTHSLTDVADYIEATRQAHSDAYQLLNWISPNQTLHRGLMFEGNTIFADGGVDKQRLTQFLSDCRRIYENDISGNGLIMVSSGDDGYISFTEEISTALTDPIFVALGTINKFQFDLNLLTSINAEELDTSVAYRFGLTEDSKDFVPTCNLGITTSGQNPEEAVNFLKMALSDEVQKVEFNDGFPVNQNVLQYYYDKNQNPNDSRSFGIYDNMGEIITIQAEWMDSTEAAAFQAYISTLDTPVFQDTMTENIVIEVGTQCLEGLLTPEQAADQIAEQLNLRMKE